MAMPGPPPLACTNVAPLAWPGGRWARRGRAAAAGALSGGERTGWGSHYLRPWYAGAPVNMPLHPQGRLASPSALPPWQLSGILHGGLLTVLWVGGWTEELSGAPARALPSAHVKPSGGPPGPIPSHPHPLVVALHFPEALRLGSNTLHPGLGRGGSRGWVKGLYLLPRGRGKDCG